jgi:hypothetical protein
MESRSYGFSVSFDGQDSVVRYARTICVRPSIGDRDPLPAEYKDYHVFEGDIPADENEETAALRVICKTGCTECGGDPPCGGGGPPPAKTLGKLLAPDVIPSKAILIAPSVELQDNCLFDVRDPKFQIPVLAPRAQDLLGALGSWCRATGLNARQVAFHLYLIARNVSTSTGLSTLPGNLIAIPVPVVTRRRRSRAAAQPRARSVDIRGSRRSTR